MAAQLFEDVYATRTRVIRRSSVNEEVTGLPVRQYGMQSLCQDSGKWVFYSMSSVSVRFSYTHPPPSPILSRSFPRDSYIPGFSVCESE